MADDNILEITTYLNDDESLKPERQSKLAKVVYQDLKRIAANRLATESANSTLTVTSLVHEAFMRLQSVHSMTWKNRRHYFGAAAEAMRRILIDRARYHLRQRREGSKSAISLDEGLLLEGVKPRELVQLDDALSDLESLDRELAEIVKLKYFAGLSAQEIAELYELTPRTASRKISAGRAWLLSQFDE
ncbi:MAG: ECF-type sigma factor [Gammaproteobacteria bacterium]